MPSEQENDFDLYTILQKMNTTKPKRAPPKRIPLKSNKTLTATLLDSHYTNGQTGWCSFDTKIELYRTRIPCIGTSHSDLEQGESVSFDIEPLSTRLKLMCKLIIIIQGAVFERSGPPKLVQDRSVQFPETSEPFKLAKSNSYEDLLEEIKLPYLPEPKQAVFNARVKRSNSRLSEKRLRNKSITSNCLSDDESLNGNYNEEATFKHYDMEHYFKFRQSSSKDYTSLPYYQYSSTTRTHENKSTETFSSKFKNQTTATDDLLDEYQLGYFSKRQLLSSQSLFEKKNFSKNSDSDMLIPIDIKPKLARIDSDLDNEIYEFNEQVSKSMKKKDCVIEENSTEIFRYETTRPKFNVFERLDESVFERLRLGPKKSTEWTINKKKDDGFLNKSLNYDTSSKDYVSKTTRKTTVTTTTTSSSSTSTTEIINKPIREDEII